MSSQQQSTPATTTATEELSRFVRYVEFRTRNLREAAASYLGTSTSTNQPTPRNDEGEDEDEPLFVDVEEPNGGWVGLTEEATDVPEDTSQQIYHESAPPPPGPIQQTTLATQRAALQALGLTGLYLELGLRIVAEDIGWMTNTASFEDVMRNLRERFPLLARLGESYGRGARAERQRRLSEVVERPALPAAPATEGRAERIVMTGFVTTEDGGEVVGELEDVPLVEAGDVGEGEEEWDALYGETYAVGGR